MKQVSTFVLCALLCIALSSCDGNRSCSTNNPVLNQSPPTSTVYNIELLRLINTSDSNEVSYYFDSYQKEEDAEYIIVKAQGPDFCAKGHFQVRDWTGLETVQKTNGKGYTGAELVGYRFTVDGSSEPIQLVYTSVESIFD